VIIHAGTTDIGGATPEEFTDVRAAVQLDLNRVDLMVQAPINSAAVLTREDTLTGCSPCDLPGPVEDFRKTLWIILSVSAVAGN